MEENRLLLATGFDLSGAEADLAHFEKMAIAAGDRIERALARQVTQALSQAANPLGGGGASSLERDATRAVAELRNQIARAKPFDPLVQDLAAASAKIEQQLQQLLSKRDSLRSIINDTGMNADQRRRFFDTQGRVRSRTADDQRYDTLYENASSTSSIGRSGGTPNEVRAQLEAADAAAVKLRTTLAEIRSLREQGGGRAVGAAAQEYIEAAQKAEVERLSHLLGIPIRGTVQEQLCRVVIYLSYGRITNAIQTTARRAA